MWAHFSLLQVQARAEWHQLGEPNASRRPCRCAVSAPTCFVPCPPHNPAPQAILHWTHRVRDIIPEPVVHAAVHLIGAPVGEGYVGSGSISIGSMGRWEGYSPGYNRAVVHATGAGVLFRGANHLLRWHIPVHGTHLWLMTTVPATAEWSEIAHEGTDVRGRSGKGASVQSHKGLPVNLCHHP